MQMMSDRNLVKRGLKVEKEGV